MAALRLAAVALATLVLLVVLLIVTFVFVGLCRLSEYNAMFSTVRAPRVKVSELYPALKTGDLLLFVSTVHAPSNSMLTQTYHSHVGLVLVEGGLAYISEAQAGGSLMPDPQRPGAADVRMKRGADLTPLLTRLKYYTGCCYVLPLSRPLSPSREEAAKRAAESLYREGLPYPSVFQILLGVAGLRTDSRHCFQHVAHLIDAAGLTPADREQPLEAAGFAEVCREVCALPGRRLAGGYWYGQPVQVLYDLDAIELEAIIESAADKTIYGQLHPPAARPVSAIRRAQAPPPRDSKPGRPGSDQPHQGLRREACAAPPGDDSDRLDAERAA